MRAPRPPHRCDLADLRSVHPSRASPYQFGGRRRPHENRAVDHRGGPDRVGDGGGGNDALGRIGLRTASPVLRARGGGPFLSLVAHDRRPRSTGIRPVECRVPRFGRPGASGRVALRGVGGVYGADASERDSRLVRSQDAGRGLHGPRGTGTGRIRPGRWSTDRLADVCPMQFESSRGHRVMGTAWTPHDSGGLVDHRPASPPPDGRVVRASKRCTGRCHLGEPPWNDPSPRGCHPCTLDSPLCPRGKPTPGRSRGPSPARRWGRCICAWSAAPAPSCTWASRAWPRVNSQPLLSLCPTVACMAYNMFPSTRSSPSPNNPPAPPPPPGAQISHTKSTDAPS